METLDFLRDRLDLIDQQVAALLNTRMQIAEKIADWKEEHQTPITDSDREHQVLAKVKELAKNPILQDYIEKIYAPLIECTKAVQEAHRKKEKFPFKKVGIIGFGVIGGSILKTLKAVNPRIAVCTCKFESRDQTQALESRLVDQAFEELEALIREVDVLVLATPISSIVPLALDVSAAVRKHPKPLMVVDVASVKEEIAMVFEKLTDGQVEFIATHPMAGTEKSGYANSCASLFFQAPWIIVPHGKNTLGGLRRAAEMIEFLGASPLEMKATDHDRKTALISHLPGIISKTLWDFVEASDRRSLEIAGPGFRSMTRLAHDNLELRREIFQANQFFIQQSLSSWMNFMHQRNS